LLLGLVYRIGEGLSRIAYEEEEFTTELHGVKNTEGHGGGREEEKKKRKNLPRKDTNRYEKKRGVNELCELSE